VRVLPEGVSSFCFRNTFYSLILTHLFPFSLEQGPDDAVVFALNSSCWYDVSCHKAFLVNGVDHRTGMDAGDVYTNLSDSRPDSTFTPCVDYRRMSRYVCRMQQYARVK